MSGISSETVLRVPGRARHDVVWADADWSGNAMTCRATSAGAVQVESHENEAWSMIQQTVLLSSACGPTRNAGSSPEARVQGWRESRDSC